MPASQPPKHDSEPMRIAPHLDLEHTKLTPTEPGDVRETVETAGKGGETHAGSQQPAGRMPGPPARAAGATAPLAKRNPPQQHGNRALWFLALAAAVLVASIFLKEVRDQTRNAPGDSTGVSGGSVMAPMPADAPAPDPTD